MSAYLKAVERKLTPKEDVHEPHLTKDIHQIQQFTQDELVDVYVVTEKEEIFNQN